MAIHLSKRDAKVEAADALARHKKILQDVKHWCITTNDSKEKFYYLSAIPIIYSAWEGYFRIACAICLRRICVQGQKSSKYKSEYSTLWLQKEAFLESFMRNLLNSMSIGADAGKINSGKFNAIAAFSSKLGEWHGKPLNHLQDFDKLVMTYSNVNADVARLNAAIIGLNIDGINFGKLNEMLGRRNDISHGGLINYPDEQVVEELLVYAEQLIEQFNVAVEGWLDGS